MELSAEMLRALVDDGGLADNGTVGWVVRDSGTGKPIAIGSAHGLGGTPGSPPYAAGGVIQQPAPRSPERLGELSRWEAPVDPTFCIGAMTPPVTPVTSPRRRPRSESPREMRVM
ncbi:hypothetical protein ACFYTC_06710 [Actinomadura nitritigenes]|uniref:hypothetical protein n=1 Tax=Actinomadura nitritigenes TaxID=134602 RepID=UPI0036ADD7A0